jgi:hypothetical protein
MKRLLFSLLILLGLTLNIEVFAQPHQSIKKDASGSDSISLAPDIWNLPPLPISKGPYPADWEGLSRLYSVPQWWREAKFGAWSHWSPQSMPEQGDWYARGMYMEGSHQYRHHLENFGHPSVYGYKDICHNWVVDKWNPDELMNLYIEMGARYFMAMGCHHDNFDCYDSKYQPWNSVNVGPKQDIVGTWEKIARKHGMRFGIGFHNTPPRTWGQFMTTWYYGEAIYGSRPFEVYGGETTYYTRNNGHVYATVLNWHDSPLILKALHSGGSTLGKVSKVELLGSDIAFDFVQNETGLTITPKQAAQPLSGINDMTLASKHRVLRITHNKGWMNDDDPGIVAPGWYRESDNRCINH